MGRGSEIAGPENAARKMPIYKGLGWRPRVSALGAMEKQPPTDRQTSVVSW